MCGKIILLLGFLLRVCLRRWKFAVAVFSDKRQRKNGCFWQPLASRSRRRFLCQPAVLKLDDTISKSRVAFGMGYLNDRCSLLIQFFEQFHYLPTLVGMQVPGGLIGEQQFWPGDDGP